MGNLKDKAFQTEDVQTHELTQGEFDYLRLLNMALQFHTLGQRIVSGYMYYVATSRLGYKDGSNLQFEVDLNKDDKILTVQLLPEDFLKQQAAADPGATPEVKPEATPEA